MHGPLPQPGQVFRAVPCHCARLLLASRAFGRVYNDELAKVRMEGTQFTTLELLQRLGPMTQNELGDRLAAGKATVSRNIQLLERHRWVSVTKGQDRRSRVVTVTPAGRRQLTRARPHWERAQQRIRAAMPEDQLKMLHELLPAAAEAALRA